MRRLRGSLTSFGVFLGLTLPSVTTVVAQDTTRAQSDTARTASGTSPAATAQTAAPPFEFSGVLFANYQYGGLKGNRSVNRFEIDRAYLTFRATPAEHIGVRVTTDVYQQRDTTRDAYYRGWAVRVKYAYGQYDFIRGSADALKASVRLGILQTVVIENEEQYWHRGLAPVAVDQNGFFASADAGGSVIVTLPGKLGEIYATITNGPGYTSRETDRFKDYAARLTLTPQANRSGFLKGLTISAWYSNGDRGSDFGRGRGTVQAVRDALRKDRAGVFVGVRDPKIVLGAHLAQRWDVIESADTTRDVEPTSTDRTGRVLSVHTTVRPLAYLSGAPKWPLAIVLRADHIEPNVDADPYTRNYIAGVQWEFNRRTSLTLDYQNLSGRDGSTAPDSKVFFVHLIAGF
jgi:hypothetical protein